MTEVNVIIYAGVKFVFQKRGVFHWNPNKYKIRITDWLPRQAKKLEQ